MRLSPRRQRCFQRPVRGAAADHPCGADFHAVADGGDGGRFSLAARRSLRFRIDPVAARSGRGAREIRPRGDLHPHRLSLSLVCVPRGAPVGHSQFAGAVRSVGAGAGAAEHRADRGAAFFRRRGTDAGSCAGLGGVRRRGRAVCGPGVGLPAPGGDAAPSPPALDPGPETARLSRRARRSGRRDHADQSGGRHFHRLVGGPGGVDAFLRRPDLSVSARACGRRHGGGVAAGPVAASAGGRRCRRAHHPEPGYRTCLAVDAARLGGAFRDSPARTASAPLRRSACSRSDCRPSF